MDLLVIGGVRSRYMARLGLEEILADAVKWWLNDVRNEIAERIRARE